MKSALGALAAGLLFAMGLGLSGMTQPAKVLGFLDVFGPWDPTLIFVMMGALLVHMALVRFILRRERPLLDVRFHLPTAKGVDAKLVLGAGVFGIGWGLGGLCPGPALVDAGGGALAAIAFVGAMAAGMTLSHVVRPAPGR